jgi:penicillin G amidase
MEGIVKSGRQAEAVTRMMQVEDQAGDARMDLEILETLDARLGLATVDEMMLSSLVEATEHLEGLLGAERDNWAWGRLHHAFLTHPLSPLVERRTRERLDVGPAPRGGSGDTVGNTAYRLEDFRQTGGSSWRIVVDVGEWDNSLMMNSPGQSGDPASPHYSDLFRPWARDESVPLLYSRRKVEAAAERRIILEPTKR